MGGCGRDWGGEGNENWLCNLRERTAKSEVLRNRARIRDKIDLGKEQTKSNAIWNVILKELCKEEIHKIIGWLPISQRDEMITLFLSELPSFYNEQIHIFTHQ